MATTTTTELQSRVRELLRLGAPDAIEGTWLHKAEAETLRAYFKPLGLAPRMILGDNGKPKFGVIAGDGWTFVATADGKFWLQQGAALPEWVK